MVVVEFMSRTLMPGFLSILIVLFAMPSTSSAYAVVVVTARMAALMMAAAVRICFMLLPLNKLGLVYKDIPEVWSGHSM